MDEQSDGGKDKDKLDKIKNFVKQSKVQMISQGLDAREISVPNRINMNKSEMNS